MEKASKERFSSLTLLSASERKYPKSPDEAKLESFDNLYADRDYIIEFDCPEYTSLCPVTGQPDLASVMINYKGRAISPEGLLKYLVSYRCHKGFHEQCVEQIYHDIRTVFQPELLEVYACFTRRGGIDINPFRSSVREQPDEVIREMRQ